MPIKGSETVIDTKLDPDSILSVNVVVINKANYLIFGPVFIYFVLILRLIPIQEKISIIGIWKGINSICLEVIYRRVQMIKLLTFLKSN